jgi:hypothetical protein
MQRLTFSAKGLRAEVRASDGWDYGFDFGDPIDPYIDEASSILDDPSALSEYNSFPMGKKRAVSYSSYPSVLALRLLSTYLRRRFYLSLQTREDITKGLIQALSDSTSIHVIRRDIVSFYENVPTQAIHEDLLYTNALPAKARRLLEKFFEVHCGAGVGLPRGLGLSATLAEYVMQPYDASVRMIPGVYRYHRFVDDIIILCTDGESAKSILFGDLLPKPMLLHDKKRDDVALVKSAHRKGVWPKLEYLGYKFAVDVHAPPRHPRPINVGIADRKVDRIKTKLILAVKAYYHNEDFDLFHMRLRFLSGNYRFVKRKALANTGSSTVRSGIFYNYKFAGSYKDGSYVSLHLPELKQLDWFYQNSIIGRRYFYGKYLNAKLSAERLSMLRKLSFSQGHLRAFNVPLTSQ